jgi:hypothetical protein
MRTDRFPIECTVTTSGENPPSRPSTVAHPVFGNHFPALEDEVPPSPGPPPAGSAISSYRYAGPGRLQLAETNTLGKPVPSWPAWAGSPPLGPLEHAAIPNKDALAVIRSNR